jgi:hypothetical protein
LPKDGQLYFGTAGACKKEGKDTISQTINRENEKNAAREMSKRFRI